MKEAIGSTKVLFIVITLIIVIMLLLAASISYTKAFKVKNAILNVVEKNGGYGISAESVLLASENEIDNLLAEIGYQTRRNVNTNACNCNAFQNDSAISDCDVAESINYDYCIFHLTYSESGNQFYKIRTHVYFDLPLFGRNGSFSFPIFGETYMYFTHM